jgi:hypothetical protein
MQSIAWASMLTQNLHTESFTQSISDTFDGKHPCKFCMQISAGKKAERKAELPLQLKKLEFVAGREVFVFSAPQEFRLSPGIIQQFDGLARRPSVPPPRPVAA